MGVGCGVAVGIGVIVGISVNAEAISCLTMLRISPSVGIHDVLPNNKMQNKGHIHAP